MVAENDEMHHIGWPLGLGFLNMRLRIVESFPAASVGPYSLHVPSASFSSVSSSSLDTESTASFFQDKSVSLAHLIGIRAGDRGQLYEERREKKLLARDCSDTSKEQEQENMSRGICNCIPPLLDAIKRINISKNNKT